MINEGLILLRLLCKEIQECYESGTIFVSMILFSSAEVNQMSILAENYQKGPY